MCVATTVMCIGLYSHVLFLCLFIRLIMMSTINVRANDHTPNTKTVKYDEKPSICFLYCDLIPKQLFRWSTSQQNKIIIVFNININQNIPFCDFLFTENITILFLMANMIVTKIFHFKPYNSQKISPYCFWWPISL